MLNNKIGIIFQGIDRMTAVSRKVHKSLLPVGAAGKEVSHRWMAMNSQAGILTRRLGALGITGAGATWLFKRELIDTAAEFEKFSIQLEALEGSSEKGKQALGWINNFANKVPSQIGEVIDVYSKFKSFGLDPVNGGMQAVFDMSNKLGGGQEKLTGITMALGQAWAKEKLQGEEILQLVERGVPVWDLLSKVTGKTSQELNKMSAKGQLGRKAIKLLMDEMGRDAAGASLKQMKSWNGMMSNLGDQWYRFKILVMQSGVFDFLKSKLGGLLSTLDKMGENGELQKLADVIGGKLINGLKAMWSIGQGLWGVMKGLGTVIGWVANLLGGWENLGFAVAAILGGKLVLSVVMLGKSLWGLGAAIPGVVAGIKLIGAAIMVNPIGAAVAALVGGAYLIIKNWGAVKTFFSDLWIGIKDTIGKISGAMPTWMKFTGAGMAINMAAKAMQPAPTINRAGNNNVNGTIKIQVDSEGRARVKDVQSNNRDVALDVDTGLIGAAL